MKELHYHHLRLLLTISQVAGIVLFPVWMFTDAWELCSGSKNVINCVYYDCGFEFFYFLQYLDHLWLFLMLPLNGLFNFGQNIAAFTVLSNVSPISYSVATVTKRVVIILTSLLLLRNPVTNYNVLGMFVAIGGIAFYNKVSKVLYVTTNCDSNNFRQNMIVIRSQWNCPYTLKISPTAVTMVMIVWGAQ